jgi:hypothetical protein
VTGLTRADRYRHSTARRARRSRRRGSSSEADHLANTRSTQRVGSGTQGGAGGDNVVHEEHTEVVARRTGPERRTVEPLGAGVTGLLRAVRTVEQTAAGNAQLTGDGPGQQFGLVVPAAAHPPRAGGRPRDHIDPAGMQPGDDEPGEMHGRTTAVVVLQTQHHLAGDPFEGQSSPDAIVAELGGRTGQREPASVAQHLPRLVAPCADGREERAEDHGGRNTWRV